MAQWITTQAGKKIDLEWAAKSGKDFTTYLKDHYAKLQMPQIKISKNAWAVIKKAVGEDTNRFVNTGIQVQRLDTLKDGDKTKIYDDIFIFEAYSIDSFKVFDKISANKVEKAMSYIDKFWGK